MLLLRTVLPLGELLEVLIARPAALVLIEPVGVGEYMVGRVPNVEQDCASVTERACRHLALL